MQATRQAARDAEAAELDAEVERRRRRVEEWRAKRAAEQAAADQVGEGAWVCTADRQVAGLHRHVGPQPHNSGLKGGNCSRQQAAITHRAPGLRFCRGSHIQACRWVRIRLLPAVRAPL